MLSVITDSMIRPGTMKRAIADAVDFGDARANGGAENHEIQRCRQYRRKDALHNGSEHARHLVAVDGFDRIEIHLCWCTRSTKISSSELCEVCRSLKRISALAQLLNQVRDAGVLSAACRSCRSASGHPRPVRARSRQVAPEWRSSGS